MNFDSFVEKIVMKNIVNNLLFGPDYADVSNILVLQKYVLMKQNEFNESRGYIFN